MPFDGLAFVDHEALDKMERTIDLISTPAKWCKGSERNRAGQYCIRGALIAAGALDTLEPVVLQSIHEVAGRHFRRIEEFNDHPRTTHCQVVEVLDRARTKIVEGKTGGPPPSGRTHVHDGNWLGAVWQRLAQRHWAPMWW
ncbi:MAG: DUF6197 family protein [Stellaceae bacterium]